MNATHIESDIRLTYAAGRWLVEERTGADTYRRLGTFATRAAAEAFAAAWLAR